MAGKHPRTACAACQRVLPMKRTGLCDGCTLILRELRCSPEQLIELATAGRARWETDMVSWPIEWPRALGYRRTPKPRKHRQARGVDQVSTSGEPVPA